MVSGCGTKGEEIQKTDETSEISSVAFKIKPIGIDESATSTRSNLAIDGSFTWAADDTVGIYPNTGGQVYFSMKDGEGSDFANFDGGGWSFRTDATYYSYYPFIGKMYLDRNRIPVYYSGQKQVLPNNLNLLGGRDYLYTHGTSAVGNFVLFEYNHLNCFIRFILTLPAGTYTKLKITAPSPVFSVKGYYDLMAETPTIVPLETSDSLVLDLEQMTVGANEEFRVYMVSAPVNLKDTEVTVSVWNSAMTEFQCKKTPSKNYQAGKMYGLTCSSWTEVPQSMSLGIEGWEQDNHHGVAE